MTDIDDEGNGLVWESAQTEEPGDQNADSRHGAHAYWSLGPDDGDAWGVELIVRDCDLTELPDLNHHLGHFRSEAAAKRAAQQAEDHRPGWLHTHDCEHKQ